MRYHHATTKMANIEKTVSCIDMDVEHLELSCIFSGNVKQYDDSENGLVISLEVKYKLNMWPCNSTSEY